MHKFSMTLDSSMLYLIAFFGFFGAALSLWTVKFFVPHPAISFARYIQYPLFISSRWLRATRLHAAICIIFFVINIGVILMPSFFSSWRQIQKRAALMAIVNIAPLCIGGRAPIIETLNIPREWYLIGHSWVGIIAVVEAVSHSVIALCLVPKPGPLIRTGWIVGSLAYFFYAFTNLLVFRSIFRSASSSFPKS